MGCDGFAVLKGLELCVAIVCIILKRVSDDEAVHIFYQLEKLSKEWPLLNSITWEENGSSFADITFGGYVIITAGLLIGYVLGELRRAAKMEVFFLLLGTLMFGTMGALCLAALESVPPNLVDNAAALGAIALVGALLFILDLLLRSKRPGKYKKPVHAVTQTASSSTFSTTDVESKVTQTNGFVKDTSHDNKNHSGVISELRSSMKGSKTSVNDKGVSPEMKTHKGQNGGFVMDEESRIGTGYHPGRDESDGHPSFDKPHGYIGSESKQQGYIGSDNRHIGNDNRHIGNDNKQHGYIGSDHTYGDRPTTPVSVDDRYKKRRHRRSEYSSGESDFDDFIHLPTVSFLLAERGEERRRKADRGMERKGTQMLPMMPVMRSDQEEFRRTRSIENLVRREDLERERRELENQRELLAREREKYLFNNRKQKEMMEKRAYSTSPDMNDGELRMRALSPEVGEPRKKSVTIKDPEDEVREKLSQQGFIKVSSEPIRRKNTGLSKSYPGSPEEKHRKSQENDYQDVYTQPTKKEDFDSRKSTGSQTPDFTRLKEHWRFDSRDANAARPSRHERKPSSPMDPGFVLHTASKWPEVNPKTSSNSASEKNGSDEEYRPVLDPPGGKAPAAPKTQRAGKASLFNVETSVDETVNIPSGGSLTTQLLQKWLKARNSRVASDGTPLKEGAQDQPRNWL